MIPISKNTHWRQLYNKLENENRGEGYRLVMTSLRSKMPFELHPEVKKEVILQLFPRVEDNWRDEPLEPHLKKTKRSHEQNEDPV